MMPKGQDCSGHASSPAERPRVLYQVFFDDSAPFSRREIVTIFRMESVLAKAGASRRLRLSSAGYRNGPMLRGPGLKREGIRNVFVAYRLGYGDFDISGRTG